MDSPTIIEEIAPPKNINNANQLEKDESKTLNEKSAKNGESKVAKPKRMVKKSDSNPGIAEMVLESIKSLRMRKGAPVEAIRQYISDKYCIDMKKLKPRVQRFLRNGLEKGYLEEEATGRFKIKKKDVLKKGTQMKMKINKKPIHEQKKITKAIRKNNGKDNKLHI